MRFVPIKKALPGMVLSKSIYDSDSRILLGAYKELTEEFINRLKLKGLPGFYIEDSISSDIIINDTISEELRCRAVQCLAHSNIDAALDIAFEIVDQLKNSDTISLDLLDLRTFDEYTFRHSINVAVFSTIVGIGLDLQTSELTELCTASILHDLGKLSIDAKILNKPARLTEREYTIMKTHSRLSYELVKDKENLSDATKLAILHHHENEDGTGYPAGLSDGSIPFYSSIIHVADIYDALTTARPYKVAFSPLESTEYLMGGCGIQFNKTVVDAFLKYVPIYPKGTSVILSNGEEALIVSNHMNNPFHPVIRLSDGRTIDLENNSDSAALTIVRLTEEAEWARSVSPTAKKSDGRIHVLAVDDMVSSLKALEGILSPRYRVSLAKSGKQALQFLENHSPDIILMDIDMPETDGIETVQIIRSKVSRVMPIIFVTALTDRNTVMRCKELEVQDYIIKPYRPTFIIDRIERALYKGNIMA